MRVCRVRPILRLTMACSLIACADSGGSPFGPTSEEVVVESGALATDESISIPACEVRGTLRNLTDRPRRAAPTFVALDASGKQIAYGSASVDLEPQGRARYEALLSGPNRVFEAVPCERIASFVLTKLETCDPALAPAYFCP